MRHGQSGSTTTSSRRWKRFGIVGVVAAIGLAPILAGTAFAATANVSNADIAPACTATPAQPTFCTFTRAGGKATVVDDARANSGTGYLRLDTPGTPGASDKVTVFSQQFIGKKLADISTVEYETYVEQVGASNPQQAPAINIEVVPNRARADGQTGNFFTLVWEPLYTATVTPETWQPWSPSSAPSGHGGWWASNSVTSPGTPNAWGFNTYTASFADVKAAMPDAVIGKVGVNQGGGNDGLRAGVDLLKVNDETFDFDNSVRPTAVAATSGNNQSAEANKAFPLPLKATVTGKNDAVVPDQDVVFTVTKGSASFGGSPTASARTDAQGVATSPTLTAGPKTGPVEVTATSGGLTTTFTETVVPKEADLAVTVAAPPTAAPGSSLPVVLTVRNNGPVAATQVVTGFQVPNGLTITKAPGGAISRDGRSVGYLTPSIAANGTQTFQVTVSVGRSVRGVQALNAGTASVQVKDPNFVNNAAQARVTVK